jgi:hypothetical protein
LPDFREPRLDARGAHQTEPRDAAVLVLDKGARLDDAGFRQYRQAQADLELLTGVGQDRGAALARATASVINASTTIGAMTFPAVPVRVTCPSTPALWPDTNTRL